jgi:hypothetical protein
MKAIRFAQYGEPARVLVVEECPLPTPGPGEYRVLGCKASDVRCVMSTNLQGESEAQNMAEAIKQEKIRRATLAGSSTISSEATVAEMDPEGSLTVLRAGTNDWAVSPATRTVLARRTCASTRWGWSG